MPGRGCDSKVTCSICGTTELKVPGVESNFFIPAFDFYLNDHPCSKQWPPRSDRFFVCQSCFVENDLAKGGLARYFGIASDQAYLVAKKTSLETIGRCKQCGNRHQLFSGFCSRTCALQRLTRFELGDLVVGTIPDLTVLDRTYEYDLNKYLSKNNITLDDLLKEQPGNEYLSRS